MRTPFDPNEYRIQLEQDGYAIVDGLIDLAHAKQLCSAIENIPAGEEVRRKTNVYGIRHLLKLSSPCRNLAALPEIRALVIPVLGEQCFAVRATFFDKVPGANWNLRWHQDSVIAVKQRIDTPGYHAWSTKASIVQVRPPVEVLENMLAIRIHLDDCPISNGALRILRGSHKQRWQRDEISKAKSKFETVTCGVPLGGALAMRPLVLHASSASDSPSHRRVIHIEYASKELPHGLEWQDRI